LPPVDSRKAPPLEFTLSWGGLSLASPINRKSQGGSLAVQATPKKQSTDIAALRAVLPSDTLTRIQDTGEIVDDIFLARWLAARGSVASTASALAAHAAWRESFVGPGGVSLATLTDEIRSEKLCVQNGVDIAGRPVLVFVARRHLPAGNNGASTESTMRLLAAAIDRAASLADTSLNPRRQLVWIFDLQGAQHNLDVALLRGIFDLLQTHYPETLARLFFVNSPWIFWGVWTCVSPFLAPKTKSKIAFASGGSRGQQQLTAEIGRSSLPASLGGVSPLIPFGYDADTVVGARQSARVSVAGDSWPWGALSHAVLGSFCWLRGPVGRAGRALGRVGCFAVLRPGKAVARAVKPSASMLQHKKVLLFLVLLLGLLHFLVGQILSD
jgi:hypothetical protein